MDCTQRDTDNISIYDFWCTLLRHFSTEHRTQISAIITQLGIESLDMTGWQYMEDTGDLQDLDPTAPE